MSQTIKASPLELNPFLKSGTLQVSVTHVFDYNGLGSYWVDYDYDYDNVLIVSVTLVSLDNPVNVSVVSRIVWYYSLLDCNNPYPR